MPLWQRLLITLAAMLVVSFLFGLFWRALFGFGAPEYVAGVIGGLTAIPLWTLLQRIELKPTKNNQ
jgi:hypothetical protein